MMLFRSLLLGPAFLSAFAASAQAAEYVTLRDGVPLREKPSAAARVLEKAGKGWVLDAGVDDRAGSEWHEVYQIDKGDGYFYAYLAYGLPGTNVFVRDADVRVKGGGEQDGAPSAASAAEDPDSPDAYLSTLALVTVKATDVRLREGAGLYGNVVGKAGRGDRFIALKDTIAVPDGKVWYRLLYSVETQEETYLEELGDRFICADFVRPSNLTEDQQELVENRKFHMLRIDRSMTEGFAARDALSLYSPEDDTSRNVTLPAGMRLEVFSIPLRNPDGLRYVTLWKRVDDRRIRKVGSIPLDELRSLPMESGRERIDAWLARYPM